MSYLLLPLSLLLLLTGCATPAPPSTTTFSGTAMTIAFKIIVGAPLTTEQQTEVTRVIEETFDEVDRVYNRWNPHSELSQLNQLPAGVQAPLSPELQHLLEITGELVSLSEGRFDPTIEPLQKVWKSALLFGKEPPPSAIEALSPALGWDKIHYGGGYFWKDHPRTCLDLGGIAKGYCVDLLVERITSLGYPSLFVEWGGEIRAHGEHPEKRPWTVYISHLEDPDPSKALAIVPLQDAAIATSGDYLQNWRVKEGERETTYCHIINPKTLRPLEVTPSSIASASVKAPTCAFADGLATAAMLFSTEEEANKWFSHLQERFEGLELWLKSR
jgi:thiamine biosynthesis lipoprotein